jgi:hypothetical protein
LKHLGFVWELGFGGEGRGRRGLGRGQPLFGSFKKIRKGFGGLILSNFKVPPNWGVLEG